MRQYHVKLHFHKQKGNYFAYDMWQWQDQVEGNQSLSPSWIILE